MTDRTRTLSRPVLVAVVAGLAFLAAWAVAEQRPIPQAEIDLNRVVNDAPDWVAHALWPVMQMGTLWGPLVVALGLGWWRREWRFAACLAVADLVVWTTVRLIKDQIGRSRPPAYVADIAVRDGTARGLGFPSGHSAMAAMTAVVCMAVVPCRVRWVLAVLAAAVGIARIVHGVHFPADVVGGWAYGVLVGVVTLEVYDRLATRARVRRG